MPLAFLFSADVESLYFSSKSRRIAGRVLTSVTGVGGRVIFNPILSLPMGYRHGPPRKFSYHYAPHVRRHPVIAFWL